MGHADAGLLRGDPDRRVEALKRLLGDEPGLLGATTSPAYAPERQIACTGLHAAVHAGNPDVARVLVEARIDIEARTKEGRTALHDSIEFGQQEITKMLIEAGAEVDVCSAAILGRLDRVRELLDGDPELANDRSTGALIPTRSRKAARATPCTRPHP